MAGPTGAEQVLHRALSLIYDEIQKWGRRNVEATLLAKRLPHLRDRDFDAGDELEGARWFADKLINEWERKDG